MTTTIERSRQAPARVPLEVPDTILGEDRGVVAFVELTMMVAVENDRSRFDSALGLTSQGFSNRCELPARP